MIRSKNHEIVKANALIEAAYRLSVSEQRIILACISQVRRDNPLTDEIMYTITAAQFAGMTGCDADNAYRDLQEAVIRLKRREVYLSERPNGGGRYARVMAAGWVQTVIYDKEESCVKLRFNKDVIPYLSHLTEQFTRYTLSDVARMTSSHAIRLYELLIQWQGVGEREVAVDWLREILGLKGLYPVFKDFKRRVIEVAVAQINACSPLEVHWQPRRTGRKATHVRFTFRRRPAGAPPKARSTQSKSGAQTAKQRRLLRATVRGV